MVATMPNAFTGATDGLSAADAALIARRDRALGPAYKLFYARPLHFVRGEGVWLWNAEGRRYLDAYNNVVSVGHCHPRVVDAIARQSAVLNTHTRYLHAGVVDYAERLLATLPGLDHIMFTCTGSEANDLALRIARAATGAEGVIVTANAYHGVTSAIAELSPSFGPGNRLGAHVWTVPAPIGTADAGAAFAEEVELAVVHMRAAGQRPAALIVDTIFSSDGVQADPAGFLAPAVHAVRRAGGLFIADEVQAGFGRLGHGMWGYARHGVAPDMVTMGKPTGNGHPVAGVASRAEPLATFARDVRYFNTFGGNPVSAAAGMAVLDVLRDEDLIGNAARVGAHLLGRLRALARDRAAVRDVRGAGLSLGVELDTPARAAAAVNALREAGVLISATGPRGDVLKIRPPLVFAAEHADMLVEALGEALGSVDA